MYEDRFHVVCFLQQKYNSLPTPSQHAKTKPTPCPESTLPEPQMCLELKDS